MRHKRMIQIINKCRRELQTTLNGFCEAKRVLLKCELDYELEGARLELRKIEKVGRQ